VLTLTPAQLEEQDQSWAEELGVQHICCKLKADKLMPGPGPCTWESDQGWVVTHSPSLQDPGLPYNITVKYAPHTAPALFPQ